MILPITQIRKFLAESACVRPNVLYPGLSETIKIECDGRAVEMTKSNHNIFCLYGFEAPGNSAEIFYVNEKALSGITQTTKSETISFSQSGNIIAVQGGPREKVQFAAIDSLSYPEIPERLSNPVEISEDAIFSIRAASKYTLRSQLVVITSFVHVSETGIFGSDGNSLAYSKNFHGLPDILLSEEALQIIRSSGPVKYSTSEQYDFFDYSGFLYGIVKNGMHKAPLKASVAFREPGAAAFIINREDLMEFCTLVNYAAKESLPTASWKYDGKILSVVYDDPANHVHVFKEIECVVNIAPCDDFKFSVKGMETILKSLPYDQLTWMRAGKHFYIGSPEDEAYKGLLAGIA